MFDIGAMELLMIVIVAVLVIGPKDMPTAMRTAGRWIGQVRKVSAHFRSGIDAMVREAELEDMEKKWKARNEEIMKQHPPQAATSSAPRAAQGEVPGTSAESAVTSDACADAADATMTGPAPSDGSAPSDAVALDAPANPEATSEAVSGSAPTTAPSPTPDTDPKAHPADKA